MSDMSKAARSAMKDKIKRITKPTEGRVDASDYGPEETDMHAEAKTGLRPISRRQYRAGGTVSGDAPPLNAGRKPRKSGGSALTPDSLINRDVREANEKRDGVKHVGGFKHGGAPKAAHGKACKCAKCSGGRVGKSMGGDIALGVLSPAAGLINAFDKKDRKAGGRTERKAGGRTNVNVIIQQPTPADPALPMGAMPPRPPLAVPAPPPMAGPPPGAGAPAPMGGPGTGMVGGGGPPVPLGRATGGRAYMRMKGGAGSGLGRLEKIRD